MKYLLLFAVFLLVLVSCKKEENAPIRNHEFGNCLKDEEPLYFEECILPESDSIEYCEIIYPNAILPLSNVASDLLPYYCCEIGDKIPFINQMNESVDFSISAKLRRPLSVNQLEDCELDPTLKKINCVNYESVWFQIDSDLTDSGIVLYLLPTYVNEFLKFQELGEHLIIFNRFVRGIQRDLFIIPADLNNLNSSLSYNFQYLPEIEILGKTYFEVYTHEEDLKGFYTKIYYNKEFGIVSFVDETGVQWRLDM
ncbi:MAG: hypothetical protein R3E32_28825 [Chitinophagales bacterium]